MIPACQQEKSGITSRDAISSCFSSCLLPDDGCGVSLSAASSRTDTGRRSFLHVFPLAEIVQICTMYYLADRTIPKKTNILQLPLEIITAICSHLPNLHLKQLRLSCRALSVAVSLRFDRVFLSAHRRDIDVFLAVANHRTWRSQVTEIVYDDALLAPNGTLFEDDDMDVRDWLLHLEPEDTNWEVGGIPRWFSFIHAQNELHEQARAKPTHTQQHQTLQVGECWEYYKMLLRQQRDVLRSDAIVRALRVGLKRFPLLRRVTITPASHGWMLNMPPVYPTPTIRAFPPGFNYPLPSGWLPATSNAWFGLPDWEEGARDWLGVRIVLRTLARKDLAGKVTDLRIEAGDLITGLNGRMFEQPCAEITHLATIIARPNFRHLHLDILSEHRQGCSWEGFWNGLLGRALADAAGGKGLEHLSLSMHGYQPVEPHEEPHEPLPREILPASSLANLKYFRLSGFCLDMGLLLSLLSKLPSTIEDVELSLLHFPGGSYRDLVQQIRDRLDWKTRAIKPKVILPFTAGAFETYHTDVRNFVYGDAQNPFLPDEVGEQTLRIVDMELRSIPWPTWARWLSDV
ncbi:hypothetical protein B0T10DRAFT_497901 [Thelonectria olida]|uniref:F-box domain-containing protein n=1 Tax=Thelonectria olida TaxID=1576542 RepID=A0A9P8VTW7_9HYPO|nr:hypothetical protein B0T10DRAFT_497901 [Thelonectria olida]